MREKENCIRRVWILTSSKKGNLSLIKTNYFTIKTKNKVTLLTFLNISLEDKNFNLIMLSNATICTVSIPKQKYCFEIENDNRKYILATKSQYDLYQWIYAIQG